MTWEDCREKCFDRDQLIARGWTPTAIKKLLSHPDVEKGFGYGKSKYFWLKSTVKKAERRKYFKKVSTRKENPAGNLGNDVGTISRCLYEINKAAKRNRDNAQNYYQHCMYGFATTGREKKEEFYDLKDQVIKKLESEGSLEILERWDGPMGAMFLVRFGDFTFHSRLRGNYPVNHVDHEELTVDAKPLTRGYRLKDCVKTLKDYLIGE